MDELLALIGRQWSLLVLYPGGVTAFGALFLVQVLGTGTWHIRTKIAAMDVLIAAVWLLLIALLPLPQTGWPYPLDLGALLLAVELLYWFRTLRAPGAPPMLPLATLLNVYPLLVLALAALGQAAGSFVLLEINRSRGPLHWIGLGAWAATLPPLLHLGPWRFDSPIPLLTALRRLAHLGLLLAAALPANDATPIGATAIGFGALFVPLLALDRWWRGDPERWITWQPWLVAVLLGLIAWFSSQQLITRLVA